MASEASSGLRKVLLDHAVQAEIVDQLISEGWDIPAFRHVVCAAADLDASLSEMLPDSNIPLLQRSKLRAAWSSLQRPPASAPSDPLGESMLPPAKAASGWSESFAPKLDSAKVASLKKAFLEAFPSEILTPQNTPSLRLLSTAVDAEVKRSWSWIPWKSRLTQQMHEDSLLSKPAKRARIETLQLSDILLDEPPQIDINDTSMGVSMVRRLLEVHDNALAIAGTAHLARLKAYSAKFLNFVSQRFPPEAHLRPPSVLEAQQADKHLWTCIFQLVVEKSWKMNDALYEFTEIRGDMASWLQPRPKIPANNPRRPGNPSGRDNRPPPPPPGRRDGKGGGKFRPTGRNPNQPRAVQWVREFKDNGVNKKLCIAWQLGKCQRGNSCEFVHGCAFPKSDGSPCLSKDHGAAQHREKAN